MGRPSKQSASMTPRALSQHHYSPIQADPVPAAPRLRPVSLPTIPDDLVDSLTSSPPSPTSLSTSRSWGATNQLDPSISPPSTASEEQPPFIDDIDELLRPWSTLVLFDVRKDPREHLSIAVPNASSQLRRAAIQTRPNFIRLISYDFSWTIDVHRQQPVTCIDVFEALYESLQLPLQDSEWCLADDYRKCCIEEANRRRRDSISVADLRRVDWLGDRTHFAGLSKDEALSRSRLFPGRELCPQTLVVKFRQPLFWS